MKKLSTYLFLILFSFQTSSWADDIRDFQIEGISIGDSALNYFSEEVIEKNKRNYYKNKKFTPVEIEYLKRYEVYDVVNFDYKTDDKNFKIYSLGGAIDYPNNISDCHKKIDEIVVELSGVLKKLSKSKKTSKLFTVAKLNDTKKTSVYFDDVLNGDYIEVACYDYTKESGFMDHLAVAIIPKVIGDFLKIAYK